MLTRSEGRCHSLTGCADRSKRGGIRDGNSARHAVNSGRDGSDGLTRRGGWCRPHGAASVSHSHIRGGRIDEGRVGRHRPISGVAPIGWADPRGHVERKKANSARRSETWAINTSIPTYGRCVQ